MSDKNVEKILATYSDVATTDGVFLKNSAVDMRYIQLLNYKVFIGLLDNMLENYVTCLPEISRDKNLSPLDNMLNFLEGRCAYRVKYDNPEGLTFFEIEEYLNSSMFNLSVNNYPEIQWETSTTAQSIWLKPEIMEKVIETVRSCYSDISIGAFINTVISRKGL